MTVRLRATPTTRMLRSLLHDSGWNLGGYVLPALAAFAATPYLFDVLGAERFGLLSLTWAVLGMVSVFDFGIGRAMTRWIAELKGEGRPHAIAAATASGLVVSRLGANIAMSRFLRAHTIPAWSAISPALCASLLGYGGWITVSSLLGPIIVYADRFIVGYIVSAAAVSYVSVPSDALSRVLIVPVSMASAAFPAIVGERSRAENVATIVRFATGVVALVIAPPTLLAAIFGHSILRVWMGGEFANASADVFRIFAVGYGINALAQVPLLALQALGCARATASWHLFQLVPYFVGTVAATMSFGIIGAATAWTLRATIDMLGMWGLLHLEIRARR